MDSRPDLDQALELLRRALRHVGFVPFRKAQDVAQLRDQIEKFLSKYEESK